MFFASPETVTHHAWTSTGNDAHGNPVATFTDEDLDAALWPGVMDESGNLIVTEGLTLMLEDAVTVGSMDEFTARGVRYRVQGDPLAYHSPLTGTEVTTVTLLRRA